MTEDRSRIAILIADDHAIVRTGVWLILEDEPEMEVAGEARDGRETLELARRLKPDVILMDISMPQMSGLDATREVTRSMPQTRVLGLTMHQDDWYFLSSSGQGPRVTWSRAHLPTSFSLQYGP